MDLSIVVPVCNECDNLELLHQSVCEAITPLRIEWELILVDDGSQDRSPRIMEELEEIDPTHVRYIWLRRNFGQTAAIAAGIDHSSGDVIVLMDADLQNDPADIPMMLRKIEDGYDVVSGWRKDRQDNLSRRLPSQVANRLIAWATGVNLHDFGCTLKAYRREVITGFKLYGEMHRFIPAFANSIGAKICEVEVHHHPRRFGKPKYGLERTMKVILDLITVKFLSSYANKPIYLFGGAGAVLILISLVILTYLFIRRVFFQISILGSPLLQMSTMILIMGFQSILMGLIAELLARTYHESQGKATYTIRRESGFIDKSYERSQL